jgi:hypothetical protein
MHETLIHIGHWLLQWDLERALLSMWHTLLLPLLRFSFPMLCCFLCFKLRAFILPVT